VRRRGVTAGRSSSSLGVADELRALTRLAFDELGLGAGGIGQVHRAIADRAFPGPGLAKILHDGISGAVYAGIAGAASLAGRAAAVAVTDRPVSANPRGAAILGVLNGLRGDQLEREGSELAMPMSVRSRGEAVEAADFEPATPRLAVFVHGLFETELAWGYGGGPRYGERLAEEHGYTPVYVRYNSGRHISENGRSLAALLDELVADWPVAVEEIILVGHSMGGLVARSACHVGGDWAGRVRHVVSLGSPHTGAPLESAVHYAAAALGVMPESRPFAGFLRRRSAGIRDMRTGSLVDEDWQGRDPEALRAAACQEVPLLDGAVHCFVAATVTREASHPVARMLGDWLVLEASASHRAQETLHVGGAHHLALLNHPAVYERLSEWLARAPRPV
jgi:pimeloyl-ACP methyl ester carboxylesterase